MFEYSQSAMLAIAGVDDEAMVTQHLHDKFYHVAVQYHLQELEMESVKPGGVVGSCLVKQDDTGLLPPLKTSLNVLSEEGHLVHC